MKTICVALAVVMAMTFIASVQASTVYYNHYNGYVYPQVTVNYQYQPYYYNTWHRPYYYRPYYYQPYYYAPRCYCSPYCYCY